LARAAGLDVQGLAATIGQYNTGQAAGRDVLGRTHMPLPIAKPPYYAVRIQGYFLLGAAGIVVNKSLQVVDQSGRAIPNLFAAGEMLGFGAFQGQSYCGGMSVTPALTFGRLLGDRLIPLRA
jgi:fumarate reductase flavoprotein subunit